MWLTDPLLSGDCVNSKDSVNTFPLPGSRFLIMQQLDYNNGNGVFLLGPCRDVISKGQSQLSSVWQTVKTGLGQREAEKSPLLEAVARERAGEDIGRKKA
jgi:hypothetical protein